MTIGHIETQRLRIRSFQPNDWQAVYDYTSDPAVMMYIPEGPFTPEQAKAFVADNMGEQARAVTVLLKTGDMLVGHMVFHPWFAPRTYEIGWVFNGAYHGHGYATEAAMALLNMALRGCTCIGSSLPLNPRTFFVAGYGKAGHATRGPLSKVHQASGQWVVGRILLCSSGRRVTFEANKTQPGRRL